MGIFSKFKKMFGKAICIDMSMADQLVYMYPLKNGLLKINTEVLVEHGFVAVVTHYDKICDFLLQGSYRCTPEEMPLLNRYAKPYKTAKGYVKPKDVQADIYFINLKEFKYLPFKSYDRVQALYGEKKVAIKYDGVFNVQVKEPVHFVKRLLLDNAIIKNKLAEKEVALMVSERVHRALAKYPQNLDSYIKKDSVIHEIINTAAGADLLEDAGIIVDGITIKNITLPKNLEHLAPVNAEKDILAKQVEERVSEANVEEKLKGLTKEFDVVYSDGEIKTQAENTYQNNPSVVVMPTPQTQMEDNYDKYANQFSGNNISSAPQETPNIIFGEQKNNFEENVLNTNNTNVFEETVVLEKPLEKRNKTTNKTCKYCGEGIRENSKFCPNCGKSTSDTIICESCGAKNANTQTECVVCHSKL